MPDPVGHLVEFIDKNRMILALVQGAKKTRLNLLTSQDKQIALPQGRVLLMAPAAISPERPRSALAEYLAQVDRRREQLSEKVDVEQLWELVHEEEDPVPLKDLAELVFGAEADDDHQAAVLRALFYERLHFKLTGGEYLPLSADQLEQKRLQQQREAEYRQAVDQAVAWLRSLDGRGDAPGDAPPGLLQMLRDLLVFEDEAPDARMSKEIVALAELGGRKQLFELLVRLGAMRAHQNLAMLREGLASEFTSDEIAAARAVDPGADRQGREDLTGVYTFTIDGQYTTDFDDALSFEPEPEGGGVLGVHITDAAALLPDRGPLEEAARERAVTLYLPDDRVPMLPPELSEDALSLRQGELRPAISFLARVDPDGQVTQERVVRSLLRVDRRLTYDEADGLLAADPRLKGLYEACEALRRSRAQAGAYFLPLPEVLVGVDEQGSVWVRRVDRDGPSRQMVAETAILANQVAGRFLKANQVPALYRTQAPPKEPIEEGDPTDLYLHFRQRRLLNPVDLTTKPGLHSSLGVEPYTHATSPIRRYLDLVLQRQIGAVLSGREAPYSKEALKRLAMEVEPAVRRAGRVRQARQRYWLLQWLKERRSEPRRGLVMEYQTRRWQILLSEIMMLTAIPSQPGLSLEPGQQVSIAVERVDPFNDILRVKLAGAQ